MGKPWDLDRKTGGVYIMQPSFNGRIAEWYKGTGDAILQNIDLIRDSSADFVLILSGDQIYTMNYQNVIKHHLKSSKPVTVATPISEGSPAFENPEIVNSFIFELAAI